MKKRVTGEEKLREKYSKKTFEEYLLEGLKEGFRFEIAKDEEGIKMFVTKDGWGKGVLIEEDMFAEYGAEMLRGAMVTIRHAIQKKDIDRE